MTFSGEPGRFFWSTGYAWGTCVIGRGFARIEVLHGDVAIERVVLTGRGEAVLPRRRAIRAGRSLRVRA